MPVVSDPRKILLVTNDLGPRSGGIETFIHGLLAKLDGKQIAIYTSSQTDDLAFDRELTAKYGLIIYRDRSKVLLPSPRTIRAVKKVMHIHNCKTIWFGAAAPLGLMAPNLRRAGAERVIALTHGHEVWWGKVPGFKYALRRIAKSADVLTYLGGYTGAEISKTIGERSEFVQISPGIATDFFIPGPKPEDLIAKYKLGNRPTLVCVGRLVHRKGQDKLISAMPLIKAAIPGAILLIIGSGPRESYLRQLVTKFNLVNDVIFLGRVSYDQLPKHMLLGDVFVAPSRSRLGGLEVEGLGIVYLEASSCGLAVIAGDSGGSPDAVQMNKTGLVVDGTNVKEISDACIKLLSQPELAAQFGANGRNWAVEHWNWDNWGAKFAEILEG